MIRVAHVTAVDLTHRYLLLGQLRFLREAGYDVTAISAPGPHSDVLEQEGIRHIPWPHISRSWGLRDDLKAATALFRIFKDEGFDLVHTHNPKPGFIGRIAARSAGIPCVVNTVHGFYARPEDRLARRVAVLSSETLAARFSDCELFQSEEDLDWAHRRGIVRPSRSVLLGNGTDLEFFDSEAVSARVRRDIRRDMGISDDAVVVGTIGRLVAEKGYREFFDAAHRIRQRFPSTRFMVVGSSDRDKPDAINDAEIAAMGKHVVFAGWRDDVRDLLATMDIFVLASYREGLPRSAVEAAAMARPLVLTDIRGCREVVRDASEGILVPARDSDALATAIERLIIDPDLRVDMGLAARRRAEQAFDERRVFDTIERTYERLLGSRPSNDTGGFELRPATTSDAGALATMHKRSLPDAFLPRLGEPFLRRLYRCLATDPEAVTIVAESGGRVVAFCSGVLSVRSFYRRFIRRFGVSASLVALPRIIRPGTLRKIIETARYPSAAGFLPQAELLSIAVAPSSRRSGAGRAVATRFLDELTRLGASDVKVVVAQTNQPANRFYEQIGFSPLSTVEIHESDLSNVWVYRCLPSSRSV